MSTSNNAQAVECREVFYLQQISSNLQEMFFKTPWGSVVVKNCDDDGKLLEFKSKNEYSRSEKSLWLNLKLKLFRDNGELFPVFCCPECPSMKGFLSLNTKCSPAQFLPMLCIHSKAVSFLVNDWNEIWDIGEEDDVVFCNEDTIAITLHSKEQKNSGFFLAGVLYGDKVFLLYSATKRQNIPTCSGHSCLLSHCVHSKKYDDTLNHEDYSESFDPIMRTAHDEDEDVEDGGEVEAEDTAEDVQDKEDQNGEIFETNGPSNNHYLNILSEKEYNRMCGFNTTKIPYPLREDKALQAMWLKRMKHDYSDLPHVFVPIYSPTRTCEGHGNHFDEDDCNLGMESANAVIYNESGEMVLEAKVMFRKTVGACKCRDHVDGHQYFLWHLGQGKFLNYCLLIHYLHLWVNDGTPKFALYKTIQDNAKALGVTSTITYSDLHRGIVGFFRQLDFDELRAFSCPKHGNSPRWMNTDGKYVGPTKKKCCHLNELDREMNDAEVLEQSTTFKNRVFLPNLLERSEVVGLLSGTASSERSLAFIASNVTSSANGELLKALVAFIEQKYPGRMPAVYKRFIQNVCKPTSVRGLIQVTNFIPLDILRSFCNEDLALKDIENIENLRLLREEIPVLWAILDDVCTYDKSLYLPREIAAIVIQLLDIRQNTFINAANRNEDMYVKCAI